MIPPDSDDQRGATGTPPPLPAPPPGATPPPLPTVPAQASSSRPLVIVAICAGVLALFMALGLAGVAMFLRSQKAVRQEARATRAIASDARELQAAPVQNAKLRPIKSEPGVSYVNDKFRSAPWSIHVVQVDRSRKDLGFYSAHAGTKVLGVSMLADQAAGIPRDIGRAIAGVNGDFYERDNRTYAGDPRGMQIINGDLISAPHTVCVWFDAEGNPHLDEVKGDFKVTWPDGATTPIGLNQRREGGVAMLYTPSYGPSTRVPGGREFVLEKAGDGPWLPLGAGQNYRARIREVNPQGNTQLAPDTMVLSLGPALLGKVPEAAPGAVLEISTATTPDLKGVKVAIAGGPAILQKGKPFALKNPPPGTGGNYSERSKYERHPRSAIGWSPTHVYLVTVDGRQPGLSVGMKLAELAEYFVGLGCTEAMNFDGGKSAQMWLSGRIVNDPCQGEDTVANSFMVIRKPQER